MLTGTNLVNLTYLHASGNVNPLDPAHTVVPGADFDGDLALVGYSRSFSLFGRTAIGSLLVPAGGLKGEVGGLFSVKDSARGFGDPVLQLDVNLFGAPAMRNVPELMRYEPDFTVDLVLNLGIPIGEYDDDSPTNIGQNRWYGRVGAPVMINLRDWVPGRRTTLEFLPAVWFFEDNDDLLGSTLKNDPMFQLEAHLTHDLTEGFWGSLDTVWYTGAKSTIGDLSGDGLNEFGLGFTLGYNVNDNLMLTAGYTATLEDGLGDIDLGVFRINLVYGWHGLLEGIGRLGSTAKAPKSGSETRRTILASTAAGDAQPIGTTGLSNRMHAATVAGGDAVRIVFALIADLYGQSTAESSTLEEFELSPDQEEWIVAVSIRRPSDPIAYRGQAGRLKEFRVNAHSGDVISMTFPSERARPGAVAIARPQAVPDSVRILEGGSPR
jgi:hypothetical protein